MRVLAGLVMGISAALFLVSPVRADDGCIARGAYFGAEPTEGISIFAPGVASTQYHDDWPPVFSADGRDVVLRILGFVGDERKGTLFTSHMNEAGCWSAPEPLPFSGEAMDGAVAFAPDGTLFFTSQRLAAGDPEGFSDERVWTATRTEAGWSEPELLDSPVNAFNVNGGLSMDADGNIYVAIRSDITAFDLYWARRVDGRYPFLEGLPGSINTEAEELAPFVDPQGRFLVYTSFAGNELTLRVGLPDGEGGWSAGDPVSGLDDQNPKFAGLSPDGERLFFVSERTGAGANPDAVWSYDRYDPPKVKDNADVFWMSSSAILETVGEDASRWKPSIVVSSLGEGLYRLTTDQGAYTTNSLAFVGDDGVLLVDTQAATDAEALKRLIEGFNLGDPKVIIFTHRHVEHVGGAAIFGEAPIVIAHDLVRTKLRSGSYLFDEFPVATMPDLSFSDRLTLHFNDEEIELVAMAGSHDDNEIIVHFTTRKVVHLSSLTNGFNLPSFDSDGDALEFAPLVARAMEELPEDVVIVSGHNENGTWHDLGPYHEMLEGTVAAVRSGIEEGRSVEEMQQANILEPWEEFAGSYVSTDQWIEYLAEALEPAEPEKKDVFEVLYYALRDHGAEAAVSRYAELRVNHSDDYEFTEFDLLAAGSKVLGKDRPEPAAVFLRGSIDEYPESDYLYYSYYLLAKAEIALEHQEEALAACRRALELKPDNATIVALLADIESSHSP